MEPLETAKLEVSTQLSQITVVTVTDSKSERVAAEALTSMKKLLKNIEDKRKSFVQPLNDHVKRINGEFKKIASPVEEAVDRLSRAILDYRQSDAFRESVEYRQTIQEEAHQALKTGDMSTLQTLSEANAALESEAPKVIRTDSGSLSTRKIWKFEVVDPKAVPTSFLIVDDRKVAEAVKSGVREIPGVRIWQEETLASRS